jgi:hypothetical protein
MQACCNSSEQTRREIVEQLIRKRLIFLLVALIIPGMAISVTALGAGFTLRLDHDANSRITVENVIIDKDTTTIFFWTWPYLGDPGSGKDCPLNFYSVTLQPGLNSVQPTTVANQVCGGLLSKGGITRNGDALILVRDRLERWREGEKISSESFSSLEATRRLGVTTDNMGGQFYSLSPAGDLVMAIPGAGDPSGPSLVITSLKKDGKQRWQLGLTDVGDTFSLERIWAGHDGGALLYISTHRVDTMMPVSEPQLRIVTAAGRQSTVKLMTIGEQFDIASVRPGSEQDLQKFYQHQRSSKPEKLETLSARPRDGGGFDVLFHRSGGAAGRAGHFLQHIGPDGSLQSETPLGRHIEDHGLQDWIDFYLQGDQLVLLSRVMATQHKVNSKRKRWMQNAVSWVDLGTGVPVSRLIPLDERYLEAAMNSGDEGRQYLEGQPGGEPAMLTSVGSVPLAVGIGWIKGRNTLRLNEATEDLVAFTETYDNRQQQIAKDKAGQQRKADRVARQQQLNADLAKSVGMTPEAFAALSKKERKEVMIRQGDPAALQAMMTKRAGAAQQAIPPQQATAPAAMNAQVAAAMAQVRQQMENNPNMTPEMRAQMASIMAQMGQASPGQASPGQAATQPQPAAASAAPGNSLKVDSKLRGFLEYENEQGDPLVLLIQNRKTNRELLKKEYSDGVIYEYMDFSRFSLPLEQIAVIYQLKGGKVLENLTPVISY